jgi:outer membrane protein OmpA-like peptidoglycan-associated protein
LIEETMRPAALLLLSLSLLIPVQVRADGPAKAAAPSGASAKASKLELSIDRSKVDLEGHQLEVKLSRPCDKVKLKVIGESGATLAEAEQPFDGAPAGTALILSWTPSGPETVARIEVWGYDTAGYYVGMAITPWQVKIPDAGVVFENDSDVIRPSEAPKLEATMRIVTDALDTFAKARNLDKNDTAANKAITLFIGGHTDTTATAEYNLGLSRRRARAIAAWFRSHGLRIGIAYEGFGEYVPAVKTEDNVAEERNRRVQYLLSDGPPPLPAGPATFSWKGI